MHKVCFSEDLQNALPGMLWKRLDGALLLRPAAELRIVWLENLTFGCSGLLVGGPKMLDVNREEIRGRLRIADRPPTVIIHGCHI